jgi:hypothetical protein
MSALNQDKLSRRNDKVRRSWAKQAPRYDKSIGFFERRVVWHEPPVLGMFAGVLEKRAIASPTDENLAHHAEHVEPSGPKRAQHQHRANERRMMSAAQRLDDLVPLRQQLVIHGSIFRCAYVGR